MIKRTLSTVLLGLLLLPVAFAAPAQAQGKKKPSKAEMDQLIKHGAGWELFTKNGNGALKANKFLEAASWFERAASNAKQAMVLPVAKNMGWRGRAAQSLTRAMQAYDRAGQLEKAVNLGLEALDLFPEDGPPKPPKDAKETDGVYVDYGGWTDIFWNLALSEATYGAGEEAAEHFQIAADLMADTLPPPMAAKAMNHAAMWLVSHGELESARAIIELSYTFSRKASKKDKETHIFPAMDRAAIVTLLGTKKEGKTARDDMTKTFKDVGEGAMKKGEMQDILCMTWAQAGSSAAKKSGKATPAEYWDKVEAKVTEKKGLFDRSKQADCMAQLSGMRADARDPDGGRAMMTRFAKGYTSKKLSRMKRLQVFRNQGFLSMNTLACDEAEFGFEAFAKAAPKKSKDPAIRRLQGNHHLDRASCAADAHAKAKTDDEKRSQLEEVRTQILLAIPLLEGTNPKDLWRAHVMRSVLGQALGEQQLVDDGANAAMDVMAQFPSISKGGLPAMSLAWKKAMSPYATALAKKEAEKAKKFRDSVKQKADAKKKSDPKKGTKTASAKKTDPKKKAAPKKSTKKRTKKKTKPKPRRRPSRPFFRDVDAIGFLYLGLEGYFAAATANIPTETDVSGLGLMVPSIGFGSIGEGFYWKFDWSGAWNDAVDGVPLAYIGQFSGEGDLKYTYYDGGGPWPNFEFGWGTDTDAIGEVGIGFYSNQSRLITEEAGSEAKNKSFKMLDIGPKLYWLFGAGSDDFILRPSLTYGWTRYLDGTHGRNLILEVDMFYLHDDFNGVYGSLGFNFRDFDPPDPTSVPGKSLNGTFVTFNLGYMFFGD